VNTSSGAGLVFGVGAGRCGTMTLANLLNSEPDCFCLHEGKIRVGMAVGEQYLPFLTLENYRAYLHPEEAEEILREKRRDMPGLLQKRQCAVLGDVAYNYAPFIETIPNVFPAAKLVVLLRDGRDFVRSVYTNERPDPTPVGWLDGDVTLTPVEKYVALGRLRPRPGSADAGLWPKMSPVAKNAWLWSETYRLILDGLAGWDTDNVRILRFEVFFADLETNYAQLRKWLGLSGPVAPETQEVLGAKKINSRHSRILPHWTEWTEQTTQDFMAFAGETMQRTGYIRPSDVGGVS
jgi:hypothetical protein